MVRKDSEWMKYVKAHKDIRLPNGLLDLKKISKMWHEEKGYDLKIKGSRKKSERLARHLRKEHPSTKGKMTVYDIPYYKKRLKNLRAMKEKFLEHASIQDYHDRVQEYKDLLADAYRREGKADVRPYDPAPRKNSKPKRWFDAMVKGIKTRSDVRNPYAIVNRIWAKLSPSKQAEIKRREAKGERFVYDLPLPVDLPTKGVGTVRTVKPFNLSEVQVNVSAKHYLDLLKSKLFSRMKRNDGSTALVKRCKSATDNVNIFIDKAG